MPVAQPPQSTSRKDHTVSPTIRHSTLARARLADRVYQVLARRGIDFAPLGALAQALAVGEAELRLIAECAPNLGVCHGRELVVYCLPPQPTAAGFEVTHWRGRLWLRLASSEPRPPLLVGGQHVGRVPAGDRDTTVGAGELAHAICRLTLMAGRWMPNVPDPTRYLFELIAEGWRHATTTRHGGFSTHQAEFDVPITLGSGAPGGGTNRLELVTNRSFRVHRLVNLYPVPALAVAR
jgi:hypothetical protein